VRFAGTWQRIGAGPYGQHRQQDQHRDDD
jgi:hypothetical protein